MRLLLGILLMMSTLIAQADPLNFQAHDTLRATGDDNPDAAAVLDALRWELAEFTVTLTPVPDGREHAWLVTFPSPIPSGDAAQDTVTLRWFPAEDVPPDASSPAVLLVHTLHPDLPVARMLARGLALNGIHAFVLEMPGYAHRIPATPLLTGITALIHGSQAIADTRRAADAIRALPPGMGVDPDRLSLQGTSLGSFVAASAAALDGTFAHTFLLLSGGDGVDILTHGDKDAFHVNSALRRYGYTGQRLIDLIAPIEPLTLAHRLDPATTWMFNATHDSVIPEPNARRLAEAIGLDASHHLWLPGNHYTAILLLPGVLDRMRGVLSPEGAPGAAGTE